MIIKIWVILPEMPFHQSGPLSINHLIFRGKNSKIQQKLQSLFIIDYSSFFQALFIQIVPSFRIIENKHSQMRFPQNQLTPFRLALIVLYLATITFSFQLTLTNMATFPLDAETFFFNRQLLYENSDTFYLVGIYDTSTRSLLSIDQTNNNNISNSAPITIDNLNRNTFFISLVMDSYLGFIYNVQSQSGDIGTLLLVNKTNISQTYTTSLYVSYIAAVFSGKQGTIFGVTLFGQVNMIVNAEQTNRSIISGPPLVNNWMDYSDIKMTKSINQNYLLIFTLQHKKFQLLSVNSTLVDSSSLTIIPQSQTNVYSVCFIRQTSLAVRQNSTISFYSLPNLQLVSSQTIDLAVSSECYLDTITNQLIFVYQQDNETIFYAYDMTTASQANTTTVLPTSEVVFTDRKIYTVNSTNPTAVSFSFFNYQSCHRNYFYDSANFICYQCPAGCNSCTSPQFCYSDCLAGNYFIDDYCCGNSQYYLVENSAKKCFNCPRGCFNCTSSQICLTCRANNYFIDDYCCKNNQYYLITNGNKQCKNCPSACLNCSSPQFCHACTTGNILINNFCCGASMYLEINAGIKTCASCPSRCHNCSSPQFCHSCTANNTLANNFCCGFGQFVLLSGGLKSCAACPSGCSNCSNATFCHSCVSGKILSNNFCCNSDQYVQSTSAGTTCQNCPLGCATCQGPSLCLTCNATWMMGIDQLCYNSTEYMPTGQQGNPATIATKQMSDNRFISFFNSFPSLRGMLRAVFGTFGWFDQLYLFQFHQRDYGVNMQILFKQMQTIQKQKWTGADWLITDRFLAIFNSSIGNITKSIDHKAKYSSSFWVKRVLNGEGFLVNTLSFFTTILIFTLVFYLIARAAFYILYKQRWSMFFRSYSFWPYLAIILMQGNLLQLIFFACGDLRLAFSLTFSDKTMNMLSWLFFFTLMMFATAMFPMLYYAYSNKARFFSQNMHKPFKNLVVVYLAIQFGFRHLLQAMLHYFLKDGPYYELQLSLLLTVQILLCASYIFFVLKECFNYKFKLWLSVLQSLLKMALLSFLLLRVKNLDVEQVNNITNKILGYIAAVYIAMIYVNFGVSCLILLKEAAANLHNRMKRDQKERLKQLAQEKEKQKEHLAKQKLRAAKKELHGQMTSNKTTIANEQSLFFRKEDRAKAISTNVVKVVRIKRGQQ